MQKIVHGRKVKVPTHKRIARARKAEVRAQREKTVEVAEAVEVAEVLGVSPEQVGLKVVRV